MNIKKRTVGIIGAKGTGKTYLTRQIISTINERAIIFDTIGAINQPEAQKYEATKDGLNDQAIAFGMMIKGIRKKSLSINLSKLTREEVVQFTDLSFVTAYAGQHVKNKIFVFDEIHDYLPERYSRSKEVERLIRHGRNDNNTFIYNTQRPAQVTKNLFNLTDVLIVFRLNWKHDLEVISEVLANMGGSKDEVEQVIQRITNQKVGEYITLVLGEVG